MTREVTSKGAFRFDGEFALAVDPIGGARIDVEPLSTDTVPMDEAAHAFEVAGDKMRSMKVPLAF